MISDPVTSLDDALRRSLAIDAPLAERLALIREAYERLRPAAAAAAMRLVARLEAAAAGTSAPRPGEPLPGFVLPDDSGHLVSLSSLLGEGPVVVVFHRGHWCPYCRLTAAALQRVAPRIAAAGGRLVAITPERRAYAARLKAEAGLDWPVLTDMDNGYALSLNLAVWVGEELQALLLADGRDLTRFQGGGSWTLPLPATFVLDRAGTIVERYVDADYRRRMDLDALVAAVRRAAGYALE
jgi:peroxiredoxin